MDKIAKIKRVKKKDRVYLVLRSGKEGNGRVLLKYLVSGKNSESKFHNLLYPIAFDYGIEQLVDTNNEYHKILPF